MNSYEMQERMTFSQGHAPSVDHVEKILRHRIVGCTGVRKASTGNDKSGVDYFAERGGAGFALHIDLKLRSVDYAKKNPPVDDLALETWSVIGNKVGWTRDETKSTDFVLWYWKPTGRFFIVPFVPLCFIFRRHWETWREIYPTEIQTTRDKRGRESWKSECVYVPRLLVVEEIQRWMGICVTAEQREKIA